MRRPSPAKQMSDGQAHICAHICTHRRDCCLPFPGQGRLHLCGLLTLCAVLRCSGCCCRSGLSGRLGADSGRALCLCLLCGLHGGAVTCTLLLFCMSAVGWIVEKRGNITMVADRRVYAETKSRPVDVRRPCVHSIYLVRPIYMRAPGCWSPWGMPLHIVCRRR